MIIYSEKYHIIINLDYAAKISYNSSLFNTDCFEVFSEDKKLLLTVPAKKEEAERFISRISEAWGKLDRLCIDDYISVIEEEPENE